MARKKPSYRWRDLHEKKLTPAQREQIDRGDDEPIGVLLPVKPPMLTVADLVALLRPLPKPDPGFWDTVEEAAKQSTEIPPSPWER
jgi:hypothetical protein